MDTRYQRYFDDGYGSVSMSGAPTVWTGKLVTAEGITVLLCIYFTTVRACQRHLGTTQCGEKWAPSCCCLTALKWWLCLKRHIQSLSTPNLDPPGRQQSHLPSCTIVRLLQEACVSAITSHLFQRLISWHVRGRRE